MKKPKIHQCTKGSDPRTFPCVAMRSESLRSFEEMVDGLASKYWRNWHEEVEDVPEAMTLAEVWAAVREEYDRYGTLNVWTWSESLYEGDAKRGREWAEKIVLSVLPELGAS